MDSWLNLAILIGFLFVIEEVYLRSAASWGIIDRPNRRSSHAIAVVRGGGIIFPLAWLAYAAMSGNLLPWFTAGLLIVTLVSFIDDVKPLGAGLRFLSHLLAFSLMFQQLDAWATWPWWVLPVSLTACIAMVNAFNFMDGINGITGIYALSILIPLAVLSISSNDGWQAFTDGPIPYLLASVAVFGFHNFRRQARCFAGDVGSIGMGYITCFLILLLMTDKADVIGIPDEEGSGWKYILLPLIYGVDSLLTIMQRLAKGENIFKAHRTHLYQYLSNELALPHLLVSGVYGTAQLAINLYLISKDADVGVCITILLYVSLAYLTVRDIILSAIYSRQGGIR